MSHRIAVGAVLGRSCVVALVAMAGCSQSAERLPTQQEGAVNRPAEAPLSTPSPEPALGGISEQELPKLGDPLPPLDEGRIEVAGPADWHVPPRDPRWLARFQLLAGNPYPVILVHQPESHEGTDEVTADNAAAFAANLARQLRRELEPKGMTIPAVEPLVIGDFAGAAYVRQATIKDKNLRLERLYLVTVRGGRRYTVELQAVFGTLGEFRGPAVAVADGMKFMMSPGQCDAETE